MKKIISILLITISLLSFGQKKSKFAKGADISWLPQMEATGYQFYNEKGEKTGQTIVLESLGKPLVKDGKLVVKDADGNEVSDHNYLVSNKASAILSSETTSMPFSSITKIF